METVLSYDQQISLHGKDCADCVPQVVGNKCLSVDSGHASATVLCIEVWNKRLLSRFLKSHNFKPKINIQRPLCSDQLCRKGDLGAAERAEWMDSGLCRGCRVRGVLLGLHGHDQHLSGLDVQISARTANCQGKRAEEVSLISCGSCWRHRQIRSRGDSRARLLANDISRKSSLGSIKKAQALRPFRGLKSITSQWRRAPAPSRGGRHMFRPGPIGTLHGSSGSRTPMHEPQQLNVVSA